VTRGPGAGRGDQLANSVSTIIRPAAAAADGPAAALTGQVWDQLTAMLSLAGCRHQDRLPPLTVTHPINGRTAFGSSKFQIAEYVRTLLSPTADPKVHRSFILARILRRAIRRSLIVTGCYFM